MLPSLIALSATLFQAQVEPIVPASWLAQHLSDANLVVVHVEGQRDGYQRGHIPGARFLALADFATDGGGLGRELLPVEELERVLRSVGINQDSRVVIYGSGNPLGAARLWMTLDYLGHAGHASLLDGGLVAWRASGGAMTTEEPAPRAGNISRRERASFLVTADWIHQRLDDPSLLLVDARPDNEYTGADNGMNGTVHPGHIPGAYQMYWEKLVEPENQSKLKPVEVLRREFEAAGAGAGKTVVAYCMVGMRASLTYLVGRMLGYEMKFYDGSWRDWGARELPYVTGKTRR